MIGWRELLILLVIALIVFGAKRLRNIGGDLGSAVRSFKKGMNEPEDETPTKLGHDADGSKTPAPRAREDASSPRQGD